MFSTTIARIAASAVAALVVGGSGTAALVACAPGTHSKAATDLSAGLDLSARADADLSAAQKTNDEAFAALASGSASGKAKAEALVATSSTQLEKASAEMHAAIDAGSKAAVDGIADFTQKSLRLVNGLQTTASVTADATLQAGTRVASAVDQQVAAARAVVTAQGEAALKALVETKLALPPPPPVTTSAQVSAGASSNTTVSAPPANAVSSLTGQLGISLGK